MVVCFVEMFLLFDLNLISAVSGVYWLMYALLGVFKVRIVKKW